MIEEKTFKDVDQLQIIYHNRSIESNLIHRLT